MRNYSSAVTKIKKSIFLDTIEFNNILDNCLIIKNTYDNMIEEALTLENNKYYVNDNLVIEEAISYISDEEEQDEFKDNALILAALIKKIINGYKPRYKSVIYFEKKNDEYTYYLDGIDYIYRSYLYIQKYINPDIRMPIRILQMLWGK